MQEKNSIYWHRWTTVAALSLAWAVLAAWQWQEYEAERETARDSLRRQAESVVNALVGGFQSHRRLGRFTEDQFQAAIDELAKSQDVLTVAVISTDNRISLTAGKADLLDLSKPIEPGPSWIDAGFRYAAAFKVLLDMPGPRDGPGPEMMPGPGGMGQQPQQGRESPLQGPGGAEPFRGPGPGRANGPWREGPDWRPTPDDRGSLPTSGRFLAVLLLDRGRTDRLIAHYAWLRILAVVGGGVVIFSIVLAWRATVRLAEARGQARLLEIETRHLRDLSQAATGLAHETRNPLGLIRGWTQRWMQAMSDGPQRHQAQAVIEECDRVTARINQFLAFARPCTPRLAPVRPAEVVAELAALVEPDLDAKRLRLVADFPTPERTVEADREMLRQALFNLIQNAVQFSPEGKTIDVSCVDGQDGSMRIEVADRGPGVPAEAVDLLFTPYHSTRADGTGLGLAIVRRIATVHGWQSGYSPRTGGGAIFWIGNSEK